MSLILYITLAVVLYVFYKCMNPKGFHNVKHLNAAYSVPFFGMFFRLWKIKSMTDMTELMLSLPKKYNSPVLTKTFGFFAVQIFKADQVEIIMKSKTNISKAQPVYGFLEPWLGLGLLTSTGSQWFHQRKILTPSFHFEVLRQFLPIFDEHSRDFVEFIRKRNVKTDGQPIDIRTPMSLSTLDIICETSMGKHLNALASDDEDHEYFKSIQTIGSMIPERMSKVWLRADIVFKQSSLGKRTKAAIDYMHTFTERVISEKERSGSFIEKAEQRDDDEISSVRKPRMALLDLLLDLKRRGVMTRQEVREQVDTFMFEGHDTTSNALIFILYCLGRYPECQQLVIDEIDSVFGVLGGGFVFDVFVENSKSDPLTWDTLNNLPYLDRFIKESQRLYPSVPFIGRCLDEDCRMPDGTILPAGMTVDLSIISLQRDPEQFPDPLRFDPDRFLPAEIAKRHPFAFVPFSAGPRNCIGQKFAQSELKAMTVQVLRNFTLDCTQTDEEINAVCVMVLRADAPVLIKFTDRQK